MLRCFLLVIVLALFAGCASEEPPLSRKDHEPVPGEATPAPETGPHGGWAW